MEVQLGHRLLASGYLSLRPVIPVAEDLRWRRYVAKRGNRPHSCSACSRGSRPIPAPVLVRVGFTRLVGDSLPSASADTAHRFGYLRHRHRISSLATVPADRG